MGEKADRIEQYIEQQRRDCQDNVLELKSRSAGRLIGVLSVKSGP